MDRVGPCYFKTEPPQTSPSGADSAFSVPALPEVQNYFRKEIPQKVLYNNNSKFFLERFDQYLKSQKWISHCIFKSCSANGRGLF